MEQLPYCLHNSRWNSPEFAEKRGEETGCAREATTVMASRDCSDGEVNIAYRKGLDIARPPKLENFTVERTLLNTFSFFSFEDKSLIFVFAYEHAREEQFC